MSNHYRPQAGRPEPESTGGLPSQTLVGVDADRAPVTFGWWLYAKDRFVGNCHLETLYRLDRAGARLGDHSGVNTLQPGEYYGDSTDKLREMLRVRQHSLLPSVPADHRWIGPQLVQEVPCSVVHVRVGTGKHRHDSELPLDPQTRLQYAQTLASRILKDRMTA